jgi:hypothetical protein
VAVSTANVQAFCSRLWLLVCRLPVLADAIEVRLLISTGIVATYSWLTAYEFWRGRSEVLVSRWFGMYGSASDLIAIDLAHVLLAVIERQQITRFIEPSDP